MTVANQIPLFEEATPAAAAMAFAPYVPVEELADRAIAAIRDLMAQGKQIVVSSSFGKDSSVVLALALRALRAEMAAGNTRASVTVLTSNTGVENPVQDYYVGGEIEKVRAYAQAHGLPVTVHVARPSLTNNYLVNMIGGRTVATTPDIKSRKCSNMMKVVPLTRAKRRIFDMLGVPSDDIVSLVGTRFSESPERAARMRERGETPDRPFLNPQGEWMMSPIAHWTSDNVFEYIGLVRSEMIECYSDFSSLVQFYRDAAEGECMVSAFVDGKQSSRPCGSSARSGCWTCLAISDDHSMVNLLKREEYSWMRPLYTFRGVLKANHHDQSKRCWLARSVNDDGTINIAPNAYSPAFCRDLLRWALTIDVREMEAAAATSGALLAAFGYDGEIRPRFRLLSEAEVLGIDVLWARYAYQRPLQASKDYHDVYVRGVRYDMPQVNGDAPMRPIPAPLAVPFADDQFNDSFAGFRDLEAWTAGAEHERLSRSGDWMTNAADGLEFEIDPEGAELFFGFELERAIRQYGDDSVAPSAAYHYLVRLGVVTLHRGGASEQDRMLRLGNQVWRLGLRDALDNPEELVRRLTGTAGSASAAELDL